MAEPTLDEMAAMVAFNSSSSVLAGVIMPSPLNTVWLNIFSLSAVSSIDIVSF